jgi:hypothetical protein
MSIGGNPYAPPQDERHFRSSTGTPATITCTFVMELDDMAAGLASGMKRIRVALAIWLFLMGLIAGATAGIGWQLGQAMVLGAFGWVLSSFISRTNARRSLANKSESERTVSYAFSNEGVEVTTVNTYSRVQWSAVHRFVEGPRTFSVYLSEAVVQVIPKRALGAADADALRAMLTSHIAPRKRPSAFRGVLVFLWLLMILMFLAVWQFLQPDRPPEGDPRFQRREAR